MSLGSHETSGAKTKEGYFRPLRINWTLECFWCGGVVDGAKTKGNSGLTGEAQHLSVCAKIGTEGPCTFQANVPTLGYVSSLA